MMRFNDVVMFEKDRRSRCTRFHDSKFLPVAEALVLINQGRGADAATL
jgi:hypothetical protein